MKENFWKAFSAVLKHEGGYVNHPLDPGGMTNLGVTRAAWQSWVGRKVTEDEMRRLTPEDVSLFYRNRYWDAVRGDELPSGIDYVVFDAAVNSGPSRAIKWAQAVAGVTQDGRIGPRTLAAIQAVNPDQFVQQYCSRRLGFMQRLPIWKAFGKGWRNRVTEVQAAALRLANEGVS